MHKCLLSFCPDQAPNQYAICRSHFNMLPRAHNDAIRASYSAGDTREGARPQLMRAIASAEAWFQEEFGGTPREKWDPGKWERLCQMVRARDTLRARQFEASPTPADPTDPDRPPFRHLRLVS
jgi:hypothetical protein